MSDTLGDIAGRARVEKHCRGSSGVDADNPPVCFGHKITKPIIIPNRHVCLQAKGEGGASVGGDGGDSRNGQLEVCC